MTKVLYLLHNDHFDLLSDDDAPDTSESLGVYKVLTADGEEERRKYRIDMPGNDTRVELPDDYDISDLQALTHLAQTLTDRHSDSVVAIRCDDDPALAKKLAAFMGTEVTDQAGHDAHVTKAMDPAPEVVPDAPVPADVTAPAAGPTGLEAQA